MNSIEISKTSNKINYITFLQSFAVVLVVLGHCFPNANPEDIYPVWAQIIHHLIYSFHMPLFFVLAGFLFMNSLNNQSDSIRNLKKFVEKKIKRLIIPYISIGTLAYLLKFFIFNKFAYRPASPGVIPYIKSMLIPCDNPNIYLWFLPTIFIIFIISYFVLNNNYKKFNPLVWVIITFLLSFFSNYTNLRFLNISGVLYYSFYFFLGTLLFDIKNHIFEYLSNKGFLILFILLFIEIQMIAQFKFNFVNYIFNYIEAILGIFISFSIANNFCNKDYKFFWGIIDGKYYQIYLLSWFFQCGIRVLYQIHIVNYPVVCSLMFISSIVFPLLIIYIVKNYIPKLKIFIGM